MAQCRAGVLSGVERGWRGARELSLELSARAIPVTHLIKGHLTRELRAMIQSYPAIQIVSVPRPLFRVWLWGILLRQTATGRLRWLLIDHERTLREVGWWCRLTGQTPVMIHETDSGCDLQVAGQPVSKASLFGA